jgi:Spy/CpxP family protein refolding chaperone
MKQHAVLAAAIVLAGSAAVAQGPESPFRRNEPVVTVTPSPYVGFDTREVKTIPPERLEGLRRGAGLGYALAAELNGLPGPMHVLELANGLQLTAEQRQRTQALFERMRREAIAAGEALIAAEAHLDRMFQLGHASAERIVAQTQVAAAQEARLRAIHLSAHLEMRDILTAGQIESYLRLRGYAAAEGGIVHGPGHHPPAGHSVPRP